MDAPTIHTQESQLPAGLFSQLRQAKRQYVEDVLPSIKRHRHFVSQSERRRQSKRKINPRNHHLVIRFSPFAMTLGHGVGVSRPTHSTPALVPPGITRVLKPRPVTQPDQLIRTFVIAVIQSEPLVYVLQKIRWKTALGFPAGGIELGETILQTAVREFREETCGKDRFGGVDVSRYNPVYIGKFVLNRATNGEQGAVVLVEIPESEKEKIVAGGGDQAEDELVEEIHFLTFENLFQAAENGVILPNSRKVLEIYLNHLVS